MAELVSSGGFRVDRSRALEKLSAFQLDDAHKALLALIRCATASGAARIRLARKPRLELAFDGRPLTAAELEDPFAALFAEEGHGDVRSRQLALGILAMLPAAGALELTGGAAAGRRRLLIPSPASFATVDLKDDPSSETRLTFALGAPRALGDSSRLETDCWASRIPIYVDGRELPRGLAPDHPGVAFDEKGRYGWVSVPQAPAAPSLLRLHVLGTRIADGELPGNTIPVAGYVNGDDFALDAGQAKVVRNDALAEAGAAVERAAERLLGETVEALSRALPDTDRLLSSDFYRRAWRASRLEPLDAAPVEEGLGGWLFLSVQRALGADTAAIRARLKDLRWQAAGLRWLRHLSGHGHRRRANAALRDLASLAPRATEET